MRSLLSLSLLAAAVVPLAAPCALEAVAQSPVGGGSGQGAVNLATDAKLSTMKTETVVLRQTVTELKTELKNVTDCAALGKFWNGSVCVEPVVKNGKDGANGEDGNNIKIPKCKANQTLVSTDGKTLSCQDIVTGTFLGFCMVHTGPNTGGARVCGLKNSPMNGSDYIRKGVALAPAFCGNPADGYKCDCPSGYRRVYLSDRVDDGGSTAAYGCLKL